MNNILITIMISIITTIVINKINNKYYFQNNENKLKEEYRRKLPDVYSYIIRDFEDFNNINWEIDNKNFINIKADNNEKGNTYVYRVNKIAKWDEIKDKLPVNIIYIENNKSDGNITLKEVQVEVLSLGHFNKYPIKKGEKLVVCIELRDIIKEITISNMDMEAQYKIELEGEAIMKNIILKR